MAQAIQTAAIAGASGLRIGVAEGKEMASREGRAGPIEGAPGKGAGRDGDGGAENSGNEYQSSQRLAECRGSFVCSAKRGCLGLKHRGPDAAPTRPRRDRNG